MIFGHPQCYEPISISCLSKFSGSVRLKKLKRGINRIKNSQRLTRQFKQLVTKQSVMGQSVQDYADQLGISVNHLNKTVKAATGYTPGQLIRKEVVLEAKRLFQHTDLTATEVGYRLGFDDSSYFGRFFKREVGGRSRPISARIASTINLATGTFFSAILSSESLSQRS